jgi:hypothetical protein
LLAIRSGHLQLSDSFGHFDIALGDQLLLQVVPVLAGAVAADQDLDYIDDREPPLPLMEQLSNLPAFEYGESALLLRAHAGPVRNRTTTSNDPVSPDSIGGNRGRSTSLTTQNPMAPTMGLIYDA